MTRITFAFWLLFAATGGAVEVELPKHAAGPITALARAARQDKEIVVTLRVIDTQLENRVAPRQVWIDEQYVDGDQVKTRKKEQTLEEVVAVAVPKRLREIALPARAFHIRKVNREKVTDEQLLELLAKETPVLLNFEPTIDAFYLLTIREETLILSTNRQRVFPDSAMLPPAPVPPRAPQLLPMPETATQPR